MPDTSADIFLTIGIPTYNRQESVVQLLELLTTIEPIVRCEILLINNGDAIDVVSQIAQLKSKGFQVNFLRNAENCGGQENCLRIYENAVGKYVWYIGDDDRIYPDAFVKVVQILQQHEPDCVLLNADTPGEVVPNHATGFISEQQVYAGEFMLGRLICAPLSVLKKSAVVGALSRARLHLGCFAPQFLLLLLGQIKTYYYLREPSVHNKDVPVARNQKLSILPIFLGICHLTEVPTQGQKKKWVKRLLKREWRMLNSPLHVLGALAIDGINGGKHPYGSIAVAGWRNYPPLLAILFSISLLLLRIFPKSWLVPLIHWYANTVKKKNIDVTDFRSMDRI
jgi:glycosyltransferase involved in cell wall biosynthesis